MTFEDTTSNLINIKTKHGEVELNPYTFYHCVIKSEDGITFTKNNSSYLVLMPPENIIAVRTEPFKNLRELSMFVLDLYENNPEER